MAPLPPDGTPRFRVNYDISGVGHDFQIRSHASPSAVGSIVDAFLTPLGPALFALTIGTVEFAANGSNIFLPVVTGIEGNVYGSGSASVGETPNFYGFVGRTSGGRRWHLDVFGARTLGSDYRLAPGENADVADAVTALQAAGTDLIGIDDNVVTVYTYVNCGVNSHWQRAVRP